MNLHISGPQHTFEFYLGVEKIGSSIVVLLARGNNIEQLTRNGGELGLRKESKFPDEFYKIFVSHSTKRFVKQQITKKTKKQPHLLLLFL